MGDGWRVKVGVGGTATQSGWRVEAGGGGPTRMAEESGGTTGCGGSARWRTAAVVEGGNFRLAA
jgi:hypothetical protein